MQRQSCAALQTTESQLPELHCQGLRWQLMRRLLTLVAHAVDDRHQDDRGQLRHHDRRWPEAGRHESDGISDLEAVAVITSLT